jgi:hypothetical protein
MSPVYQRTPRGDDPALRLRTLEWAVFLSIDGVRTALEIQRDLGLSSRDCDEIWPRLLKLGVIEERDLSLAEYVAAAALSSRLGTLQSRAEFLSGWKSGPDIPGSAGSVPGATEPARSDQAPTARPDGTVTPKVRPAFSPLPVPGAGPKVARALSLKQVMKLILDRYPDETAGQLAIYRVFINVDNQLLRKNGINSLRFSEDRSITDRALQVAIQASVEQNLGMHLPESVWAEGE